MEAEKKKYAFWGIIGILALVLIVAGIVIAIQGPRTSPVEVVSRADGTIVVDDLYAGKMTIPDYDIPTSPYGTDDFVEEKGVISLASGGSYLGINVSQAHGEIDWAQVAKSGVEYAMVRMGFRGARNGKITLDSQFETNIKGAAEAGLDVGVYFFSQAISDNEAEEEATFVLEQLQGTPIQYPVAFYWDYVTDTDGNLDPKSRTKSITGEQITGFVDAFCKKISKAGHTSAYFADKTMAYEKLNLGRLSSYDLWYSEHQKVPSFRYDFKMWQYTSEGTVPGIEGNVPVSLALKSYSS